MQHFRKLTDNTEEKSYFEFTTEIPTTLQPTALYADLVVCGSEILKLTSQEAVKASKFPQPATSAALRSDGNLMAACHANSVSISATRQRAVLKQFKCPSQPRTTCFVGISKIACGTENGELIVWDLALQEVVFAVQLGIEIFVLAEYCDNLLCFGEHQCVMCNLSTKEIEFLGKKRQSTSEFEHFICDFPGKAYSALDLGDQIVLCTDLGLSIIDVKARKVVKNLQILKGVSEVCFADNSLIIGCFDGCIRRCTQRLERVEVLERLRQPIFYISEFKYNDKEVFCVATNQPRVTLFSCDNLLQSIEEMQKFDPLLLNNGIGQFIQFPKPDVIPNSIEMLMRSHTYGKALEVALEQQSRQTVLNILYDVCESNEKALAGTVFYLSDESKICLYKYFLDSFGTRDFAVLGSAIAYQLQNTGIEQGVIGGWQGKILEKAYKWIEMEEDYEAILGDK